MGQLRPSHLQMLVIRQLRIWTQANIAKSCIARLAEQPLDLIVMELGDGIMGSYGVDSVLFDDELRSIPKAMMMAANDPVGAWGAVKWLEDRDWDFNIDYWTRNRQRFWKPKAIRDLTGVPAINARAQAKEMTDTVPDCF